MLEPYAPKLENLFNHDKEVIPLFGNLINKQQGLILVTGPTGSGKSTTIASLLQHRLDNQGGTLLTIEDPVEFYFDSTNESSVVLQRNVGIDTESFGSGLRAGLRQHPNIILVGEMRDKTSILEALQAAQTGHLVVATLHTNSAKEP